MPYNGTLITILTICVIIYSFYHYNNKNSAGLGPSNSVTGGARYNIVIDPERTDLSWYEKLVIKYAKRKNKKHNKASSTIDNNNLEEQDSSSVENNFGNKEDSDEIINEESINYSNNISEKKILCHLSDKDEKS